MYTGDCVFAELLDLARDAVRHFVVELLERRLANQLARRRSARVCVLISSSG